MQRPVRIFALASFLNDLGSDMVFSVWPLYVTEILKANMVVLGFIDGLGETIVSISGAVSGYLSDKIKQRKPFIWLGYLFGGLSRIGYALSPSWQFLIPFRVIDRSGKIRSVPRDAIISDLSTKENRGRNFGLLRAMDNLGAVTGVIIAIVLLSFIGYRNLFLLASIPSLVGAILIIFIIKESKSDKKSIFKGIRFGDLDHNLKLYTILSALFALGSFSYSFLLIFAKRSGFPATTIPILYLLFNVVAAVTSYHFGKLSDRVGRKRVLYLSFLFWIAVSVLFIFFKNYFAVVLSFIFYGLHKSALEPVQKTLVSELAPKEYVASTLGAFQMIIGLCSLPASLLAGVLWDRMGINAPFILSVTLTCFSTFLLLFVKER